MRSVGSNGGQAAAFTYDLALSVVTTRQGNPASAGQELDGQDPIRADDMFFPDWVDFTKIQIPARTAGWGDSDQVFDVLDNAVQKGPWLLGDTFSAADIMIGSGLHFAIKMFKMVPTRPSFDRYIGACEQRPAFQRALKLADG